MAVTPTHTAAYSGHWGDTTRLGAEREIFGKVRYMSSANTSRKVRVAGYIKRYS
jgi:hypothetical protein